jgi:DNA-binding response OmpR family regulator
MRLLLIEDDAKAARLLRRGLGEEGFVVDVAETAETGDEMATVTDYDVIVLDWVLQDRPGIALCRDLRARGVPTPVLMLTARSALRDRVAGLDSGADDYLTKPFAFAELLARVRALLRRSALTRPVVLTAADLALDPRARRATRGGRAVHLTPREYAILEVLMRHAGEVVSRAQLAERVWEDEPDGLPNLVDVHVSHLRKKVDGGRPVPLIQTVRGSGYRLTPPVV